VRILLITAGAADMFCGSCLRDNALARELKARGHDVTLAPVYTPTRVDVENVSQSKVLFGGVSVFLQQASSLFRHTPWVVDRLWDSTAFLRLVSKRSIQVNASRLGSMTVSTLLGEHGNQRKEIEKLLHWIASEPAYDVINIPNALLIGMAGPIRGATGRPVCVTLQGEDLFLDGLPEADRVRSEELVREHAQHVDLFLSVSAYYKDYAGPRFRIEPDRIAVTPLGVSTTDLTPGGRTRLQSDPFVVGYFARIAPEKSLHLLAQAYRVARRERGLPPSRLEAAGYLAAEHQPYLARIERDLADWGLADEFRYHGTLDRAGKIAFLRGLDAFSVPSTYVEPKGLYLLEAMACGIPVVAPNHGSLREMVSATGGGLLVTPDDPESFADGLMALREHPGQARDMGLRGAAGVREHYTEAGMAEQVLAAYASAMEHHAAANPSVRA